MDTVVRPPWLPLLGLGMCCALIGASPGYVRTGGLFEPLSYGVMIGAVVAGSIGQRSVTVIREGAWVKRSYADRFFCQWTDVVAVSRRRIGPVAFDQLLLRDPVRKFFRGKPFGAAGRHVAAHKQQANLRRAVRPELAAGSDREGNDGTWRLAGSNHTHQRASHELAGW
jgi:hypothetical protein